MRLLLLIALGLLSICTYSQPLIQWQNTIGSTGNETFNKMTKTHDGGFVIAGRSATTISGDKTVAGALWVLKLSDSGNILWQKGYTGIASYGASIVRDIKLTKDNGFVIIADISVPSNGLNYGILKLDSAGNMQWQKSIGGNIDDIPGEIIETLDNGYLIAGGSSSHMSGDKSEFNIGYPATTAKDFWIVKIDSVGNIEWENTIGGTATDEAYTAVQFLDSTYLVAGGSSSSISNDKTEASKGASDFWVVKLSQDGNILWDKTIGGSGSDFAWTSALTSNQQVLLAGASESGISGDKTDINYGLSDFWIMKIDSSANIIWQNTMGGNGSDIAFDIYENTDQSVIACGRTNSNQSATKSENLLGGTDCWLVKLSSTGTTIWENTIGGSLLEDPRSVVQANDGGYLMSAISNSPISFDKTESSVGLTDFWVVKIESDGAANPVSTLNIKVFLQGYMNVSNQMVSVLQNQGVGSNNQQVDSIEIELVDPITLMPVVTLQTILMTDGTATCTFPALNASYYILVKHRNTLLTWSATPVLINAQPVFYDFTTSANKAYGDNQVEITPTIFAYYSGDLNSDENIDLLDLGLLEADISNFQFGYLSTDINGDGNVDLLDVISVESNITNFVFSSHP